MIEIKTTRNDFDDALKAQIGTRITKRLNDALGKDELTAKDLAFLSGMSQSVVRGRIKDGVAASEIVRDGFERDNPARRWTVSVESIKAYVASLPPDERAKLLTELQG